VKTDYDGMARSFEDHAADGPYNAHYDRPAVLELVGDVAGKRVLDAGCGPGLHSQELVERDADVVALDGSPAMVELARKRLGSSARVVHAHLTEPLPFAAAEFDLIVCALVLHHLDDREACLREFFRMVRPAGGVVLSTQHPTTDWLRKGGSYFETKEEEDTWHRGDDAYTVHFRREPLTAFCAAIARAGFLIERLVEPLPAESMRERWPDEWEKLQREPGFLVLRLVKP
jgi:2-polyprenyl-3-methyl-5-hydroxy-6-metoxy-1,4-benzoquinol methylase